jgi:hypothetical protein
MTVAAPRARPSTRPLPARTAARAAQPARRPAPAKGSATGRIRLTRGAVWILVAAGLLAGIVAINVTLLQLRMERGRLQSEIVQLRAENTEHEAELSGAAAVGRIEAAARRLGLAAPTETTYLQLGRSGR